MTTIYAAEIVLDADGRPHVNVATEEANDDDGFFRIEWDGETDSLAHGRLRPFGFRTLFAAAEVCLSEDAAVEKLKRELTRQFIASDEERRRCDDRIHACDAWARVWSGGGS